jgi:glycosyltransferase involved in cell wall biosynthesis
MIVDHFNTLTTGGAAIAALRVHAAVHGAGVASRFWHSPKCRSRPDVPQCRPVEWSRPRRGVLGRVAEGCRVAVRTLRQKRDLARHLAGHPAELEFFSAAVRPRSTPFDPIARGSDVIHLHWIAKLIDYPSFFAAIPDDFPIVWTLHDMNALTGGCHYTVGCEAYATECGHCPLLGFRGARDLAQRSFQVKRAALSGKNLHVVAASRWLEREARRSPILAGARGFSTIPYGLDTKQFAPREQSASRRRLQLPDDAVVVAFGAEAVDNVRKGVRPLLRAMARLRSSPRVMGVFFGRGTVPVIDEALPELRSVGFIGDAEEQAALYSAADLLVLPSLEDNLPQTGLEAMACATPVVGFDVGGIPDFVRHGETGLLANVPDVADLARQIQRLVDSPDERRAMGRQARRLIEREFCQENTAAQYLRLYQRLTAERGALAAA